MPPAPPQVTIGAFDGVLTYLVDRPPEALPPVTTRDLLAAWDAAREAAADACWGAARLFRFRRGDGSFTDLALADQDACCWAGAVDGTTGMQSAYGLSLCLRLLALVDLLAHAAWTHGLVSLRAGGTDLHPALVRAAARAPLTAEARFDEQILRGDLVALPADSNRAPTSVGSRTGAPK
jgi:hypothetical protein